MCHQVLICLIVRFLVKSWFSLVSNCFPTWTSVSFMWYWF